MRVNLDEEEVKKAIAYYVRQKFHLGAVRIIKVEVDYSNNATVRLEEDDE